MVLQPGVDLLGCNPFLYIRPKIVQERVSAPE